MKIVYGKGKNNVVQSERDLGGFTKETQKGEGDGTEGSQGQVAE